MGFWQKLFGKKSNTKKAEEMKPNKSLEKNLKIIKEGFLKDCDDIVYREIELGKEGQYKAATIHVDGMADKKLVNEFALNNLMVMARGIDPEPNILKKGLYELVEKQNIAVTELKEVETIDEAVTNILSGETVLLLDNYDKIIIIASKGWPARSPAEPETEAVIRGPRDGLVETLRMNTTLIRRRIRDHRLKVKNYQVGVRSKTDVSVMYIDDIVDKKVLKELDTRLNKIDIDAIIDSAQIEELIEDKWISVFPQIQNTERPDVVASALYHGRIGIVVDNSPFALIVPSTISAMLQSAEDYYERWQIASVIRMLRYFCLLIALFAPALYVGITSFHPQMIPTDLALALAATRRGVPFPAIIEALIMEITIEILREASIRLPGAIGSTIGIVGGLVIGQAAVEAGIVGPLMVIVVAITAIASFAIPSYNTAISIRMLRFLILFAAAAFGLYGIMLASLLILIHLCGLKSFGIPYLSPFITFLADADDLKDTLVRAPQLAMNNRDINAVKGQKNRMDDKREETFDIEKKE
ncbi:spore germination protein [Clostridium formicaceticum]|uniref:Spore germination protein n=1 Tax=Clostridium formicaceticum TaxID=1497 RepID=A0AAC9WHZ1_9CLOT|nr:spore germination protein [Clostridium formicaceticum]AOY75181.1 spore germination protein [Clostridium formicaceticum]ARE89607.1 Spore germination protein B1 [Clostridium formicaceticum]